jgi:spectinomycin phosphotransferase
MNLSRYLKLIRSLSKFALLEKIDDFFPHLQNQQNWFVPRREGDLDKSVTRRGVKDEIYIVGWDEPIMAPKERDLMFIGGGVGNVWNNVDEVTLFYKGYGKTEINSTVLAYYRHERIVEDIAIYGRELLLTTTRGQDRAEIYRQFISMFEPRGVVDIAFKDR